MRLFCKKAASFPDRVKEAFQFLHALVPFDPQRRQLGLSEVQSDGSMAYWAANDELVFGDLSASGLEEKIWPAGDYQYIVVKNHT